MTRISRSFDLGSDMWKWTDRSQHWNIRKEKHTKIENTGTNCQVVEKQEQKIKLRDQLATWHCTKIQKCITSLSVGLYSILHFLAFFTLTFFSRIFPQIFSRLQQRTSIVRVGGVGAASEMKDEVRWRRARSNVRHRVTTETSAAVAVDEVIGVVEWAGRWRRHANRVCSNTTIPYALRHVYSNNRNLLFAAHYIVSQKLCKFVFVRTSPNFHQFRQFPPILIIFGRKNGKEAKIMRGVLTFHFI